MQLIARISWDVWWCKQRTIEYVHKKQSIYIQTDGQNRICVHGPERIFTKKSWQLSFIGAEKITFLQKHFRRIDERTEKITDEFLTYDNCLVFYNRILCRIDDLPDNACANYLCVFSGFFTTLYKCNVTCQLRDMKDTFYI